MIALLGFIAFCLFAPLLVLKLLMLVMKVLELTVLAVSKLLIACLDVLIWLVNKIDGYTLSLSAQYNGTARWWQRCSVSLQVYKTGPAPPGTPCLRARFVKTRSADSSLGV